MWSSKFFFFKENRTSEQTRDNSCRDRDHQKGKRDKGWTTQQKLADEKEYP
jgi:hypothetical protein